MPSATCQKPKRSHPSSVPLHRCKGLAATTPTCRRFNRSARSKSYLRVAQVLISFNTGILFGRAQEVDVADLPPAPARGSDALEKRRTEKKLIARMLDMDEPIMTEKVHPAKRRRLVGPMTLSRANLVFQAALRGWVLLLHSEALWRDLFFFDKDSDLFSRTAVPVVLSEMRGGLGGLREAALYRNKSQQNRRFHRARGCGRKFFAVSGRWRVVDSVWVLEYQFLSTNQIECP